MVPMLTMLYNYVGVVGAYLGTSLASLLPIPSILPIHIGTVSFDLLWAVCHLSEELEARDDLSTLPSSDLKHIESDIQRAFGMLVREWLAYMRHLQIHYPYMYSLFVRINPFNPDASPLVK